jgi:hypothetical protein
MLEIILISYSRINDFLKKKKFHTNDLHLLAFTITFFNFNFNQVTYQHPQANISLRTITKIFSRWISQSDL